MNIAENEVCEMTKNASCVSTALCSLGVTSMKTYRVAEVMLHSFLIWARYGGTWSALRFCRYTPGKEAPCALNRKLDWPQNRCGHEGEENDFLLLGIETWSSC
jgi:hypothetical protein